MKDLMIMNSITHKAIKLICILIFVLFIVSQPVFAQDETVNGNLTVNGHIQLNDTAVPVTTGTIWRDSVNGLQMWASPGSEYDFYLWNRLGNTIMRVPANTSQLEFGVNASSTTVNSRLFVDTDKTDAFVVRKNHDAGDIFVVDTLNSRVGIGTDSPSSIFNINGLNTNAAEITFERSDTNGGTGLIVNLNRTNTGNVWYNNYAFSSRVTLMDTGHFGEYPGSGGDGNITANNSLISLKGNSSGTTNIKNVSMFSGIIGAYINANRTYNISNLQLYEAIPTVLAGWNGGLINVTNLSGMYIKNGMEVENLSITNQTGIRIEELQDGINTYELWIEDSGEMFFRDSDIHMGSLDDGHLDLSADLSVDVNSNLYVNGNVGIGTSAPNYKLDVAGQINGDQLCIAGNCLSSWPSSSSSWSSNGGNIYFDTGHVGIGTNSPLSQLHIAEAGDPHIIVQDTDSAMTDSSAAAFMRFYDSAGAQMGYVGDGGSGLNMSLVGETGYSLTFNSDGNRAMTIDTNQNVGIGTTSPTDKVSIVTGAGNADGLGIYEVDGGASGGKLFLGIDGSGDGYLTLTHGNNNEQVRIHSNSITYFNGGNVGIGTTSPTEKLHVAGNIQVDGNINAKYQDLAEWVMTSERMTPGTVVMIDTEKVDHVTPSDREYNTLVAGVVSPAPGIILGEEGENKAIIAHTGRVKVKVDTSSGAISVGDLLVTSPVKGYAMRADSDKLKPGMLLGKALQPLEKGRKGEVLALITLQ